MSYISLSIIFFLTDSLHIFPSCSRSFQFVRLCSSTCRWLCLIQSLSHTHSHYYMFMCQQLFGIHKYIEQLQRCRNSKSSLLPVFLHAVLHQMRYGMCVCMFVDQEKKKRICSEVFMHMSHMCYTASQITWQCRLLSFNSLQNIGRRGDFSKKILHYSLFYICRSVLLLSFANE